MSESTAAETHPKVPPHFWKPCVLLIDDGFFGGKGLGLPSDIATTLQVHREKHKSSWMGFTIQVPFGANSEDDGFGMCHERKRSPPSTTAAQEYKLTVEFPMDSDYFIRSVEQSLLAALPENTKTMSRLDVYLREGTRVTVKGYGKPFDNPDHPTKFLFVITTPSNAVEKHWSQELPGPFRYPYGDEHSWSIQRYEEQIPRNRGPQFEAALSFDNDNEHLTAMTQSQVQDAMWIYRETRDIAEMKLRAYFINVSENSLGNEFYAVVALDQGFLHHFRRAWQQLVKEEFLQLKLFGSEYDQAPASWDAKIMDNPRGLAAMVHHQMGEHDLVLRVRRPPQGQPHRRPDFDVLVFSDRRAANIAFDQDEDSWNLVSLEFNPHVKECKRNVDAVCMFHPRAPPSNLAVVSPSPIPQDVKFKMALQRALLRGNGFYDILVRGTDDGPYGVEELVDDFENARLGDSRAPRRLPIVNLLDLDHDHLIALLQDVLPEDRSRFYNYMSKRPLGLGCISAGPGFGKTTAISVATIGMAATLGKIYAIAPSHVAVDTFAERLTLVLRSPAVRELHEDDPESIWQMQRDMDARPEFGRLRDVATGRISWEQYRCGDMVQQGFVTGMFLHLVKQADILCTTPSLSCNQPYKTWKEESARGIAVDEAGNISRPDLYSAWGNTLLPCLLSGDEKQLRPTVLTAMNEQDPANDAINRFAPDALMSPLEFFTSTGWPIYRLRVQLRMARGLFDTCHREVYSDLPFTYGVGSNLARHGVGVTLERYLTRRFPDLTPSTEGTLSEVFVHCQGTVCDVDGVTKSKKNPAQVDGALNFLCDFVRTTGIDASRLAIITPYRANVELVARRRRAPDMRSSPTCGLPKPLTRVKAVKPTSLSLYSGPPLPSERDSQRTSIDST
ncbi:hypothetical protein TrVFT333_010769 [Trichoderma virens FT-333]|nr:hypothetical protein TrVFT333_010769 [Trichoderma virens FT-333]